MEICEKSKCCGCEACVQVCSHGAIVMKAEQGFYYPVIQEHFCCLCGECMRVCPALNHVPKYSARNFVFAAFNKEKHIRDSSSSGGVFYSLALEMIRSGGSVYGAELTQDMTVRHVRINKKSDIHRLQKSKYLQSVINTTYQQVKRDLNSGYHVLYTGLPCQIAGLRNYLGAENSKLITCELLCHGAASPIVFQNHIEYMSNKLGSRICNVDFRYKNPQRSQCIAYMTESGKRYVVTDPMKDYFYYGFLAGILLRDCCYQCSYIGKERCADITLGDFWGLNEGAINRPDEVAYPSCVLLSNTEKAMEIWNKISDSFICVKRCVDEAVAGNLCFRRSIPRHRFHDKFFITYAQNGYYDAAASYLVERYGGKEITKKLLGRRITSWLIKILHR